MYDIVDVTGYVNLNTVRKWHECQQICKVNMVYTGVLVYATNVYAWSDANVTV